MIIDDKNGVGVNDDNIVAQGRAYDDNGESVNDDDIGAEGGAFELEFGFALDSNFVPPFSSHGCRISFFEGRSLKFPFFLQNFEL